jgi:hypothetical protein
MNIKVASVLGDLFIAMEIEGSVILQNSGKFHPTSLHYTPEAMNC